MEKEKKIPDWKQYEWLISKIMHDKHDSWSTKVINDVRIKGEFSETLRQIDILIDAKELKTIVECKHHASPIDIKDAESFMSMMNDVNADHGILISSSGYTSTVPKRIREFGDRIKLERMDWEKAYESSFNVESYGKMGDICSSCNRQFEAGKEVPGLLCWGEAGGFEINGKISLGIVAKCLKCSSYTVYCDSCGWVTVYGKEESCCELRDLFVEYSQ